MVRLKNIDVINPPLIEEIAHAIVVGLSISMKNLCIPATTPVIIPTCGPPIIPDTATPMFLVFTMAPR